MELRKSLGQIRRPGNYSDVLMIDVGMDDANGEREKEGGRQKFLGI